MHRPPQQLRDQAKAWIADVTHKLRTTWLTWLVLGLVMLNGLILQWARLGFVTVWYDEFLTLWTIKLPWERLVLGQYTQELHPPLYFLLLKAVVETFGRYELGLRLVSLLFATLSMPLIFMLGHTFGNEWTGLGAATILAFHPLYLYHATEIRMYSLLVFWTLLGLLAFFRYSNGTTARPVWLVLLLLATTAALYTHYFGVLLPLCIGVFSLYRQLSATDRRQRNVLLMLALCGLLFLPWALLVLGDQIVRYRQSYPLDPAYRLNLEIFPALFSGSGMLRIASSDALLWISLAAVLAGCILLDSHGQRLIARACLLTLALTALLVLIINHQGVRVVPRYLLHINLLAILVIACTLLPPRSRPMRWARWLGIGTILLHIATGVYTTMQREYPHPNWRQVALFISQASRPEEAVAIIGWDTAPLRLYLRRDFLTPATFEQRVMHEQRLGSYIVVVSAQGQAPPFLAQAPVLYEAPDRSVRVMRYTVAAHNHPAAAPAGRHLERKLLAL